MRAASGLRVQREESETIEAAIERHCKRTGVPSADVVNEYRVNLAAGMREEAAALDALFGFDIDDCAEESEAHVY